MLLVRADEILRLSNVFSWYCSMFYGPILCCILRWNFPWQDVRRPAFPVLLLNTHIKNTVYSNSFLAMFVHHLYCPHLVFHDWLPTAGWMLEADFEVSSANQSTWKSTWEAQFVLAHHLLCHLGVMSKIKGYVVCCCYSLATHRWPLIRLAQTPPTSPVVWKKLVTLYKYITKSASYVLSISTTPLMESSQTALDNDTPDANTPTSLINALM